EHRPEQNWIAEGGERTEHGVAARSIARRIGPRQRIASRELQQGVAGGETRRGEEHVDRDTRLIRILMRAARGSVEPDQPERGEQTLAMLELAVEAQPW